MLKKIEILENLLAEARAKISPIAFEQWLASSSTKVLKLQLELDLEELKDNWISSRYSDNDEVKARGQAEYIDGMLDVIPLIRGDNA